jgi:hypothetical protein
MYSPAGLALLLADREAYLKANPNPTPYATSPYPSRTNTYGGPQGQPTHMVYDTRAPPTQQRSYPAATTPYPNRYNNPPHDATRITPVTGGTAPTPVHVPSPAMAHQQTGQPLPKQYTKPPPDTQANLLQTGYQMLAQSLQDQEAEDFQDDTWDGTFQGHIVITDVTEDERLGLKVQIQSDRPKGDSVVDSGADTMMLGDGWKFIDHQANRFVNVRGFDEHCSRKTGLRVGTAVTVMLNSQQQHVLVIAHEAVDNGPNQTSLLSVGQMQHNHIQVDTTRRHTGGHQHIKDPSSGLVLPLSFNRGMYRLANRIPTSYEIRHLPRITLTSVTKWNPHRNDDDDLPMVPPLISADTLTYHSQPGDSKSEGSSGLRGGLVVDITSREEKCLVVDITSMEEKSNTWRRSV